MKTLNTRKLEQPITAGTELFYDICPHYTTPLSWLPGVRVLLAFLVPLIIGILAGNIESMLPISIGAGMLALVDPGGTDERRGITITGACFIGASALALGSLVGSSLPVTILLICITVFALGLSADFGTAGVRGGFFIATCALVGVTQSDSTFLGIMNVEGILSGGLFALFLAIGPFRQKNKHNSTAAERIEGFKSRLSLHLRFKTAIGQHALRMSVAAGIALCVAALLGISQIEWAAAATVSCLHPAASHPGTRSAKMVVGTILGCGLAALVIYFSGSEMVLFGVSLFALFFMTNLRGVDYASYTMMDCIFFVTVSLLLNGNGAEPQIIAMQLIDALIGFSTALLITKATYPIQERNRLASEMECARAHADTTSWKASDMITEKMPTVDDVLSTGSWKMPTSRPID